MPPIVIHIIPPTFNPNRATCVAFIQPNVRLLHLKPLPPSLKSVTTWPPNLSFTVYASVCLCVQCCGVLAYPPAALPTLNLLMIPMCPSPLMSILMKIPCPWTPSIGILSGKTWNFTENFLLLSFHLWNVYLALELLLFQLFVTQAAEVKLECSFPLMGAFFFHLFIYFALFLTNWKAKAHQGMTAI